VAQPEGDLLNGVVSSSGKQDGSHSGSSKNTEQGGPEEDAAAGFLPSRDEVGIVKGTGVSRTVRRALTRLRLLPRERHRACVPGAAIRGDLRPRLSWPADRPALEPVVIDALVVSLKTTLTAQLLRTSFGTPTAYLLPAALPAVRSASRLSNCRSCSTCRRGIGLSSRSAASAARLNARLVGITLPFTQAGPRRGRLRFQPALCPAGDRCFRGGSTRTSSPLPHTRRRPRPHLLPRSYSRWREAVSPREALRSRGAWRVRRHDHVRRQLAEGDPDAAARDLRAIRGQLQTSPWRSALCSS